MTDESKGEHSNEKTVASSTRAALRIINDDFNLSLKSLIAGDHTGSSSLRIGYPSQCLIDCGFPVLPIEISVRTLMDKMCQPEHPFSLGSVVHMPDCIINPIAVFQSINRINTKVVLTEMTDKKGINLVVAIELGRKVGPKIINDIRSVYPKDSVNGIWAWMLELDLMEYCHKQKTLDWIGKQPSNPAEVTKHIEGFTNVVQKSKSA